MKQFSWNKVLVRVREQRQLKCRLPYAHTKWEMSMSWRSLKQNILIEFWQTDDTLDFAYTKENRFTLFLETKYWIAAVNSSHCVVWIRFLSWKFSNTFAQTLILASWNDSHGDNKTIPFHLNTPQAKIDYPIISNSMLNYGDIVWTER